ncbi:hypothetical protein QG516_09405 [Pedobacter gandavensis]|uniref:hypothetical protein n=1 Tax=Pedobacter gandavensis TaxID=2679963 RepID=UPI00247ADA3B|nr:hypothetical protein [Pedobacter gandavensis]WGQ11858.1 hypothetical protein QG516_09405 [Pedobacter gandavensis]
MTLNPYKSVIDWFFNYLSRTKDKRGVKDRTVRLMFAFNVQLLVVVAIFFSAFLKNVPKYIYIPFYFLAVYILQHVNRNYVDKKDDLIIEEKNTLVDHISYYFILLSPLLVFLISVIVFS